MFHSADKLDKNQGQSIREKNRRGPLDDENMDFANHKYMDAPVGLNIFGNRNTRHGGGGARPFELMQAVHHVQEGVQARGQSSQALLFAERCSKHSDAFGAGVMHYKKDALHHLDAEIMTKEDIPARAEFQSHVNKSTPPRLKIMMMNNCNAKHKSTDNKSKHNKHNSVYTQSSGLNGRRATCSTPHRVEKAAERYSDNEESDEESKKKMYAQRRSHSIQVVEEGSSSEEEEQEEEQEKEEAITPMKRILASHAFQPVVSQKGKRKPLDKTTAMSMREQRVHSQKGSDAQKSRRAMQASSNQLRSPSTPTNRNVEFDVCPLSPYNSIDELLSLHSPSSVISIASPRSKPNLPLPPPPPLLDTQKPRNKKDKKGQKAKKTKKSSKSAKSSEKVLTHLLSVLRIMSSTSNSSNDSSELNYLNTKTTSLDSISPSLSRQSSDIQYTPEYTSTRKSVCLSPCPKRPTSPILSGDELMVQDGLQSPLLSGYMPTFPDEAYADFDQQTLPDVLPDIRNNDSHNNNRHIHNIRRINSQGYTRNRTICNNHHDQNDTLFGESSLIDELLQLDTPIQPTNSFPNMLRSYTSQHPTINAFTFEAPPPVLQFNRSNPYNIANIPMSPTAVYTSNPRNNENDHACNIPNENELYPYAGSFSYKESSPLVSITSPWKSPKPHFKLPSIPTECSSLTAQTITIQPSDWSVSEVTPCFTRPRQASIVSSNRTIEVNQDSPCSIYSDTDSTYSSDASISHNNNNNSTSNNSTHVSINRDSPARVGHVWAYSPSSSNNHSEVEGLAEIYGVTTKLFKRQQAW